MVQWLLVSVKLYLLAGDKVVVDPLVIDTPCTDQSPDPIEQELPDLYPSCAVSHVD